jgi:hypothetical protein
MIEVKGTPLARVGLSTLACDDKVTVTPPCENCRQVSRWMPRTVAWANAQASRFKAIMYAILAEHDDVLASFCGNCFAQDAPGCDCFLADWKLIGLPRTVETISADDCLIITRPVVTTCQNLNDPVVTQCWNATCATLCAKCEFVQLDPCNNPDHLNIMTRVYAAKVSVFGRKGTGSDIVAVLGLLFPGTTPAIIHASFGVIYATIGRDLTSIERRFLPLLISAIPLGLGVEIEFLTAATCKPPGAPTSFTDLGIEGTIMAINHGTFTGTAPIALSASGLPSGVTFTDNGNGTYKLTGTWPAAGTYLYDVAATNVAGTTNVTGNRLISSAAPIAPIPPVGAPFTDTGVAGSAI